MLLLRLPALRGACWWSMTCSRPVCRSRCSCIPAQSIPSNNSLLATITQLQCIAIEGGRVNGRQQQAWSTLPTGLHPRLASSLLWCSLYLPGTSQAAIAVGDDKLRPTLPKGLHPGLAGIARATLDGEPSMRPSFASVVEQLTPIAAEVRQAEVAAAAGGGGGLLGRMLNR